MKTVLFKEIESTLNRLEELTATQTNVRHLIIDEQTELYDLSEIALKDCKEETKISRFRFQLFNESTKRNSTVYVYIRETKDGKKKFVFECDVKLLEAYKVVESYEERKVFKTGKRDNIITTNYVNTLSKILTLVNVSFKKGTAKKKEESETAKEA